MSFFVLNFFGAVKLRELQLYDLRRVFFSHASD
jgi:hypothetical protein